MRLIFSILLPGLSIGIALALLFAVIRFAFRKKYRERYERAILRLPDANRERFLKSETAILQFLKLGLCLFLPLLVLMPLATLIDSGESLRDYFLSTVVCMVLFFFMILQEYWFRKWLIDYLKTRAILK